MPKIGGRFVELMTCVRKMKCLLKGKIKGVEVLQNFSECVNGDKNYRPYVMVEYREKYFKEALPDSKTHPDKIIHMAAVESGLTKLFQFDGEEVKFGRRDLGFVLKKGIVF